MNDALTKVDTWLFIRMLIARLALIFGVDGEGSMLLANVAT